MNEDLFFLGIKGIIRNSNGEILLLKVNTSRFEQANRIEHWDIPGGRIQIGESIEEALKREIYEETGIKEIKNIEHFSMVLSNIRISKDNKSYGLILSIYMCDIELNEKIILSDEHTTFEWFNPKQASNLLSVKYPKDFTEKLNKFVDAELKLK